MTANEARTDDYTFHWTVFIAAVGGCLAIYWLHMRPAIAIPSSIPAVAPQADAFLVVRLPEVPLQETSTAFIKGKIGSWLTTMQREGFHYMKFSEIRERLSRHEGLPDRTVVLLIDPGYRHTYEVLSPIFSKTGIHAVWMTTPDTGGAVDRRFLSAHALDLMKAEGLWEVGRYQDARHAVFDDGYTRFDLGGNDGIWTKDSGHVALNQGLQANGLERLNANVQWTDRELMDRLLAELPIQGASYLTTRRIQSRPWGISAAGDSDPASVRFDLQAPLDKRAANMAWAGTRGMANMEIQLEAQKVTGELWLTLRTDEDAGQAIAVGFSEGNIMIEEEYNHVRDRLLTAAGPASLSSLSTIVLLTGSQLTIKVDGIAPIEVDDLHAPVSRKGAVRFAAFHRINGAAQATGILLKITPMRERKPGPAAAPQPPGNP
jgi:hypothetical protein